MTSTTIQACFSPPHDRGLRGHISKKFVVVASCLTVIAAISILDTWFAVANSQIIMIEKNPVCKFLLKLEPSGYPAFILGKAIGTMFVLTVLPLLHWYRYPFASLVTGAIVIFQLGLLSYLTLSDPMLYDLPNFAILFRDTPESIWRLE